MTSSTKNRLLALGALLVAGGALAVISWGNIGTNLVYYWTPSQLLGQGEKAFGPTIRLGGIVQPGSLVWNSQHTHLDFKVADSVSPDAPVVAVATDEIPPQMFREGIGVVVEGTIQKGNPFKTNRLMVSHSNEYRPPKAGEDVKNWQKSLEISEK